MTIMEKKTVLLDLFKKIYKIRKVENKIASLYTEWEMRCPVHLSIGQEAIAAGVCQNLKVNDKIISSHRCHAHYLAKGGNLKKMIAEIYGKEIRLRRWTRWINALTRSKCRSNDVHTDCSKPYTDWSWHRTTIFIFKKSKKYLTVIFFGEGATEEGIFHETVNFAALNNLPILFVCENNYYSVYTHLRDRQPKKRKVKEIFKAHGLKGFSADGNDALGVHRLSKKVIRDIKKTSRPSFIEFKDIQMARALRPILG